MWWMMQREGLNAAVLPVPALLRGRVHREAQIQSKLQRGGVHRVPGATRDFVLSGDCIVLTCVFVIFYVLLS